MHIKKGFTLLEFLVVIGILGIAISSIFAILISIIKGNNQANVTTEVKQNGQTILDSLEKQIRNAKSVECKNSNDIVIACNDYVNKSIKYIKLIRPVANNYSIQKDPLHIKCFDTNSTVSNGKVGLIESSAEDPADNTYISVSNTDTISGVDITNCSFNVLAQSDGLDSPAIIRISFTAKQGVNAPSRADFDASVQFSTSISLRNY